MCSEPAKRQTTRKWLRRAWQQIAHCFLSPFAEVLKSKTCATTASKTWYTQMWLASAYSRQEEHGAERQSRSVIVVELANRARRESTNLGDCSLELGGNGENHDVVFPCGCMARQAHWTDSTTWKVWWYRNYVISVLLQWVVNRTWNKFLLLTWFDKILFYNWKSRA